jgi:hypothetical protein
MSRISEKERARRRADWQREKARRNKRSILAASGRIKEGAFTITGEVFCDPIEAAKRDGTVEDNKGHIRALNEALNDPILTEVDESWPEPLKEFWTKQRTCNSAEQTDAERKKALFDLTCARVGDDEVGRWIKLWLKNYLCPPPALSERAKRDLRERWRAYRYNEILKAFYERGEKASAAYDFIIKYFGQEFKKPRRGRENQAGPTITHNAVDRFLYRASKGEFGPLVPRYKEGHEWERVFSIPRAALRITGSWLSVAQK